MRGVVTSSNEKVGRNSARPHPRLSRTFVLPLMITFTEAQIAHVQKSLLAETSTCSFLADYLARLAGENEGVSAELSHHFTGLSAVITKIGHPLEAVGSMVGHGE